jgi:carboxyl-terminal processing protease
MTENSLPTSPGGSGGRSCLLSLVAIVVVALVFAAGFGIGFGAGHFTATPASAAAASQGDDGNDLYPTFDIFWEAMDVLYRDFYGERPDAAAATYGAIRGVIGEFEDRNTSFMTPEEADFFRSDLQGSFEGIGARVDWDQTFDTLIIVEPFENQPAWNAGVKRDDLVVEVDGEEIIGTDLTSAVQKIRGPKGSTVKLTIMRQGEEAPLEIEIVRDRIEIPTLTTDTVGGNLAYIRLNSFNENAGQLVRQAVKDALANEPAGLILDLRGNPGGLLEQAVEVASVFLEDKDVLIERFADGTEEVYTTRNQAEIQELPLVVLVNGASASASEIVAGAVQDHERGQLVGVTTFGKGSVQLPQTLSDGSILRVTIANWFTPDDRTIDGKGLEPDVVVEFTDEQREAGVDPQLDKAIELLGGVVGELPVE